MRLKMARAVEGCLYNLLKVIPERFSRYSKDRMEEVDMLPTITYDPRLAML